MTRKIRQARRSITRELFEHAHVDVLTLTLRDLLVQLPDAQIIELAVIEHYDEAEPEQLALFDREGNPCP